jgi:hypothetical protein
MQQRSVRRFLHIGGILRVNLANRYQQRQVCCYEKNRHAHLHTLPTF